MDFVPLYCTKALLFAFHNLQWVPASGYKTSKFSSKATIQNTGVIVEKITLITGYKYVHKSNGTDSLLSTKLEM